MSRVENLVKVVDPDGNVQEVRRRNATDLVQHSGWDWYDKKEGGDVERLSQAPRSRGTKVSKVKAAQKKMFANVATPSPEKEVTKKRGRPHKNDAPPVENKQGKPAVPAKVAEEVDEELAALEAEERARGAGEGNED